jgi:hypothetical protein
MSQFSSTRTKSISVEPKYPRSACIGFATKAEKGHVYAVYQVDGVKTQVYISKLTLDEFQSDEALQALSKEDRITHVLSQCKHYVNELGGDYSMWYDTSEYTML